MSPTDWDAIFDRLYLKTYGSRTTLESGEQDVEALSGLLALDGPLDVLDSACGFGRHAIPLARAGHRVAGHDRSPVLLAEAERNAGDVPIALVQGDYRELQFADASFDLVLNLFSALGYWGDEGDLRALTEFRRVLRPGGRLVIETMHRDRLAKIFQPRTWDYLDDGAIVIEEREYDIVAGVTRNELTYRPLDGPPQSAGYEMRVYSATEWARMLTAAGFERVAVHGDLAGAPFALDTRLVAVAHCSA